MRGGRNKGILVKAAVFLLLACSAWGLAQVAGAQAGSDRPSPAQVFASQLAAHEKLLHLPLADRAAAYVRQSEIPCTMTRAADRTSIVEQVEVSCAEGRGYLLTIISGLPAAADCLMAQDGEFRCGLPDNRHPELELRPFLMQAGLSCDPRRARVAGVWKDHGTILYEVTCSNAGDYILSIPNDLIIHATAAQIDPSTTWLDCLQTPWFCKLTGHAQQVRRFAETMRTELATPCQIEDVRYVGALSPRPLDLYEVSCRGAPGLLLATDTRQHLVQTTTCADAATLKTACNLPQAKVIRR